MPRDLSWLKEHSCRGYGSNELREPYCVKGATCTYAVATTGVYLIAITLLTDEALPFKLIESTRTIELLEAGAAIRTAVAPSALIAWLHCTKCNDIDVRAICPKCEGKGRVICHQCNGTNEVTCQCGNCKHIHTRTCGCCLLGHEECDQCAGTGAVRCKCRTNVERVMFARGVSVNRAQFRLGLSSIPIVTSHTIYAAWDEGKPTVVRLESDDWKFVIGVLETGQAVNHAYLVMDPVEVLDVLASISPFPVPAPQTRDA